MDSFGGTRRFLRQKMGFLGMSTINEELVFLVLQFLKERGYNETAHTLERESGFYIDLKYLEDMVLRGKWDETERYLSGFTHFSRNTISDVCLWIRAQEYFEAIENDDSDKASGILMNNLKFLASRRKGLFESMEQLFKSENKKEHILYSQYKGTEVGRILTIDHVKKDIEADSHLSGKLRFPINQSNRLCNLIIQSWKWWHRRCIHPNPILNTLFVDHVCQPQYNLSIAQPAVKQSIATSLLTYPGQSHISVPIPDDIPKTLARTLNEESSPMSMDFHPVLQTLLLVGTCAGSIGLWNVSSGEKLLSVNFKVLDIGACSTTFKEALLENPLISVNRIMWSPDGLFFGVAYSKHILQVFSYSGGHEVWLKLETDAHVGNVNDLAFTVHHRQLLVITCGSDNKIKVWDVHDGTNVFTIGDHSAAVYSVCPHTKKVFHYVFSTFVDGKMKGWLYDNNNKFVIAVFDYDTPGLGCTKLAYSTDGQRLFSCGTNINGESFLVEWYESEGMIKRTYQGLTQNSLSVVHFDTTKNQFLAAGDNHIIKFWDMDKVELLGTIDVEGGLPEKPRIRFNKEGTLLAISANENRIKILATDCGLQLLQTPENVAGVPLSYIVYPPAIAAYPQNPTQLYRWPS
ncbi:hypothetical protein RGQ29_010368 [Quercus rubra]|uniref:CTLH domain-containing protein n=1 Tax=Quercus rubra TaxID=3512 RepID=A0AAN7J791_QUERU|nr:hypothetical protein RGQ29_010368 [Quercus rubra]